MALRFYIHSESCLRQASDQLYLASHILITRPKRYSVPRADTLCSISGAERTARKQPVEARTTYIKDNLS